VLSIWLLLDQTVQAFPFTQRVKKIADHQVLGVLSKRNTGLDLTAPSDIFEDRNGEFWIAWSSKLYRYNKDRNYWSTRFPGLKPPVDAELERVSQTNDGMLWLSGGTTGPWRRGLAFGFDGTNLRGAGEADLGPGDPLNKSNIKDLQLVFPGRQGRIWFVFTDWHSSYLLSYDGVQWGPRIEFPFVCFTVFSGLEGSDGSIWITAGWDDAWSFDKRTLKWDNYGKPRKSERGYRICYEDRQARIWFRSSEGSVAVYDRTNRSWTDFNLSNYLPLRAKRPNKVLQASGFGGPEPFRVYAIYEDLKGQILFATVKGLVILAPGTSNWRFFDAENSALPGGIISSLLEDRSGRIWLGTSGGIVILDR